jgi:hypothetical protein
LLIWQLRLKLQGEISRAEIQTLKVLELLNDCQIFKLFTDALFFDYTLLYVVYNAELD